MEFVLKAESCYPLVVPSVCPSCGTERIVYYHDDGVKFHDGSFAVCRCDLDAQYVPRDGYATYDEWVIERQKYLERTQS